MENCPPEKAARGDEAADRPCDEDVCIDAVVRHNHTLRVPVIDANVTLARGVFVRGESTMTLDIARWNSVSGWREHFLVMALGELCFVYEDIVADIMKVLAEASGVSTRCPIREGRYSGSNARAQLAPLRHFPSLPYGRYRVHTIISGLRSKRRRACMRVIADVVPKN
ncbi:hypothetical protein ONE63_004845 [Megalurothrips usitatus]|uniref:Uncharacterized protein n=1 Tax=Megalurothrips usitatus TaxID=439358 RepID=A0AAV7X7T2_9NEOP|nr:hypothetical protein ONE63_004845 [Megalurothrips usitatus]